MALNVKVGIIPPLDMLKYRNMGAVRSKAIEAAEPVEGDIGSYHVNDLADALHPLTQDMIITEIEDYPEAGTKMYTVKTENGRAAAYFSAGQFISVTFKIEGEQVTRPYFICSSPKLAAEGILKFCIKVKAGGFVSVWAHENLKVGDKIRISGPDGYFTHNSLRDHKKVIALAFDNSITPFLSMAHAVNDGTEDFNLTIIAEAGTEKEIYYSRELSQIKDSSTLNTVYCLSDEKKPGFVSGTITPELIRQYAKDEEYSILVAASPRSLARAEQVIKELNKPKREVRYTTRAIPANVYSCADFPEAAKDRTFRVTIWQGYRSYSISAHSSEPLLVALERARIKSPGRCRSGECSWCRSKLLSGDVFVPEGNDHRRRADKDNRHIHPCCSYPVTDLEIEIPGSVF